jgi:hypothetical protein
MSWQYSTAVIGHQQIAARIGGRLDAGQGRDRHDRDAGDGLSGIAGRDMIHGLRAIDRARLGNDALDILQRRDRPGMQRHGGKRWWVGGHGAQIRVLISNTG